MAAVSCYVAEYDDPVHAKTVSDLLNGYALDQFGNSAPLEDEVRAKLCSELSKIPGAFSVVATIGDEPVGLINCFQGFSTFKCKPLINIHDVFVVPEHRRKGVTQVMMAKVSEVGGISQTTFLSVSNIKNNKKKGFESFCCAPVNTIIGEYGYS